MKEFKPVEISDREWVVNILNKYECPTLEYSFTTMFIWQKIYNIEILEHNGFLHERMGENKKHYLFPAGIGDKAAEIDFLFGEAKKRGEKLSMFSINADQKAFLEENYQGCFEFKQVRDSADYIYTEESLRTLTGKKLAAKRNHINRFMENNPEWKYESLNDENIKEAINMHNKWCEGLDCENDKSLYDETCAVKRAFKYYKELELVGGMLRIDSGICAFSIGDKLNDNTFLVHIEKAFADIQGAYPMINKQFVINNCNGFEFINREDDAGDEGLRRAKLSYNPYKITVKYNAKEI